MELKYIIYEIENDGTKSCLFEEFDNNKAAERLADTVRRNDDDRKFIMEILKIAAPEVKLNRGEFSGKICMVRTYSAGVHFGSVKWHKGRECMLVNARRVYSWQNAASLSQLAMEGSGDIGNCKITIPVDCILLTEAIELIPMTKNAIDNLTLAEAEWKM